MKKIKKLHLFLASLLFGAAVTVYPAYTAGFTTESLHEWGINGLLVAAIVGFIAQRYLKSKGMLY